MMDFLGMGFCRGDVFVGFFVCLLCFSYWWGFFYISIHFHPLQYFFYERTSITVVLLLHTSTSAVPGKLTITIISLFYCKVRPCSRSLTVGKRSSFTRFKRKAV